MYTDKYFLIYDICHTIENQHYINIINSANNTFPNLLYLYSLVARIKLVNYR